MHRADRDLVLVEHGDLHQNVRQLGLGQEGARQVVAPVRRPDEIVELDRDQRREPGATVSSPATDA